MAHQAAPSPDLDLRLVRAFTVVAAQGHFGRAAEELSVAQPALSRQIRRLEERVGTQLLERTPRGSRLTLAGMAFLAEAGPLLRSADDAVAAARAAVSASSIVVGYVADLVLTPLMGPLRERHPDAEVHTRHLEWDDGRAALVERRVDALLARLPAPFPTDGLRVTPLYEEQRVLVVPIDHRLAGRESVRLEDFAEEPVVRFSRSPADWAAFWRFEPRPDGHPAPPGLIVETFEDKLERVAAGAAVAVLPAGDRRPGRRRDLVSIPIEGVEPGKVAVFVRGDDESPLVQAFVESAKTRVNGTGREP